MSENRTLVVTDNRHTLEWIQELARMHGEIDIVQSPRGSLESVPKMDVRLQWREISDRYALVMSVHCKQIFPADLVRATRCVNVHPGFNPYHRGWYPHVFSMIGGGPAGATIHEMDEQIDHGPIIVQKRYEIQPWDDSASVYRAILTLERELIFENYPSIKAGKYTATLPGESGNLNSKKDFEALCRLDLNERGTFGEVINRLRACTHGDYKNAYFVTGEGRRVYVRLLLEPES
jgi:methionyl-tRNA formyltransferase